MLSHASDNAAESGWRQCCRGDMVAMRFRCRVMLTIVLPSHADDSAAGVTWLGHDIDVESYWRQCYRVMLLRALPGPLNRSAM
jgi:hypothetical protein